jgi:hypothetical protein
LQAKNRPVMKLTEPISYAKRLALTVSSFAISIYSRS